MRSLRRLVWLGLLPLLAPFVPGVAGAEAEPLPAGDDVGAALFSDVPDGAWFEEPVAWLVGQGITSGVGNGRYGATDNVTRAQMAAFLHRAAGSPAVAGDHDFGDVPDGAWFDTPVAWLVQEGITSGVGPGRYGPNDLVTRAQMAAFLYRANGSPAVAGDAGFSDVPDGAWFDTPVAWLVEEGITSGVGNGRYGATDNVTRAQMAAFLHRAAGSPAPLHQLERLTLAVARNLVDGDALPAEWSSESSVVDALNAVTSPQAFTPGSVSLASGVQSEGRNQPPFAELAHLSEISACAAVEVLPGTRFVREVRCVADAQTSGGQAVEIELVMFTEIFSLTVGPGETDEVLEIEFLFLQSISIS